MHSSLASGTELNTWKEVAAYLGRSVRTVQEWERKLGLPVRRLTDTGRVTAFTAELDAWKAARLLPEPKAAPVPAPSGHSLKIGIAVASVAVAAAVAAVLAMNQLHREPDSVHLEGSTLTAIDRRGHVLWQHDLPNGVNEDHYIGFWKDKEWTTGDIDRSGHTSVLLAYFPKDVWTAGSTLLAFDDRGNLQWRFTPGRQVTYRETPLFPPYLISKVQVLANGHIALSAYHHFHAPNQVTILDGKGKILQEYWHSGHLYAMTHADLDGDGNEELLLGGMDNGLQQAELIVLDPRDLSGVGRQLGSEMPLHVPQLGLARERWLVLLPKTCLVPDGQYNQVNRIAVTKAAIEILVQERGILEAPETILYQFDHHFRLLGITASEGFLAHHKRLERAGAIRHDFERDEIPELRRSIRVIHRPD